MAIAFARSERISRGKGGNAVRSAAYAMREKLFDERTGVTYKFKDDGTLQHAGILLSDGTDPAFLDAATLFNAIERAEKRKDAQVAQHVVLALDPDISHAERVEMANGFARQIFVDRGRPVLVAIHSSHDGSNPHAHLIGGTRKLDAGGFSLHKDRETAFARVLGRAAFIVQSERERVGELWRDFQTAWFSAHGKAISVDPVAPIPQEHIGPRRFTHPNDHRIAANEQARELNTKIARDPQAVAEHMHKHAQPFDGRALDKFLTKYLPPDEREDVAAEVRTRLHNFQREALQKAAWSDKVASGLRPLSVEDVARELSPEYADLLNRASKLRKDAPRHEWERNRHDLTKEAGAYRVPERWSEMGVVRRLLHVSRAWRDHDTEYWTNERDRGAYLVDRSSIRLGAIDGEARQLIVKAEIKLGEKWGGGGLTLRQAAEIELIKRQRIARIAREGLDTMQRDDKVRLRARRSLSRGPSL